MSREIDFNLRDVFSLRQLEDVLLSVNNGQSTIGIDLTNVTSVEPAFVIDDFLTVNKQRKLRVRNADPRTSFKNIMSVTYVLSSIL